MNISLLSLLHAPDRLVNAEMFTIKVMSFRKISTIPRNVFNFLLDHDTLKSFTTAAGGGQVPVRKSDSGESKLLGAISSLKRIAGLPNSDLTEDCFNDGYCCVFAKDSDSAHLLHNLLAQAFDGVGSLPDQIERMEFDFNILHEVKFPAEGKTCQVMAEKIRKLTETLKAPTAKLPEEADYPGKKTSSAKPATLKERRAKEFLDAISSLKRAAGLPEECNADEADTAAMNKHNPGTCTIWTEDYDSFLMLENLLTRAFSNGDGHRNPEVQEIIESMDIRESEDRAYGVEFMAPVSACSYEKLTERIRALTESLIGPDKATRMR